MSHTAQNTLPEQFFYSACKTGDMKTIKKYSQYTKIFHYYAFTLACENNQLKAAQWLLRQYNLDPPNIDKKRIVQSFIWACKNGYFEMIEWLHSQYNFSTDDIRTDDNFALRWACDRGHFTIVKWLATNFELTIEDIRTEDNFSIYWACMYGYFDLAQWLITYFEMVPDDVVEEFRDQFVFFDYLGPKSAAKI